MPLWLVIMVLGATGCGWLFLKARRQEASATLKKVKQGHKEVKKAAQHAAHRPSGMVEPEINASREPVNLSQDLSGKVVKDLEEIAKKKGL